MSSLPSGPHPRLTTVRLSRGAFTKTQALALAAKLVEEMILVWQQGGHIRTEDFLARHPELWDHPEAAADLIFEEVCLHQEHGLELPLAEVLQRFPQWRPQLEVLLGCHHLLAPADTTPRFPSVGERLGDFLLLAELGQGAQGCVFLANQVSLGERPVVLKLTPCEGQEHLSLARLQHTYIVPLHSVQDYPKRGLRALCMPYFGGTTLAHLLAALQPHAPAQRTGQHFLDVLTQAQRAAPVALPVHGPAHQHLASISYIQAICGLGVCLAEALQFAHDRGLVHLDLKPANVLVTVDGQPMLLDFHVARAPLATEGPIPSWLGGTPGYMSPEQQAALMAIQHAQPIPQRVDGRSDIYSLGVVLYEALSDTLPESSGTRRALRRANPQVSVGLADIVGKCLQTDPARRYPNMAALAGDLRRHLTDQPLRGVGNRSWLERWRKWRRRRPHGLATSWMILTVVIALGAVLLGALSNVVQRTEQARQALRKGVAQLSGGQPAEALASAQSGTALLQSVPFQEGLRQELTTLAQRAEQARLEAERVRAVRELHLLAERIRFLHGAEAPTTPQLRRLEGCCRDLWTQRQRILEYVHAARPPNLEQQVHEDLLDLAILWAELLERLSPPAESEASRTKAIRVLDEAKVLFGENPVLEQERRLRLALPRTQRADAIRTAWEHCALGRSLLRAANLREAAAELEQAVRLQPEGLWPNFYQGVCAFRLGRYEEAVAAFSVCIGAAPQAASCYFNRALAHAALGRTRQALNDYDQALRLDPTFATAVLNRGVLHFQEKRYSQARADLQQALALQADPVVVYYNLALVYLARGERSAARTALEQVLRLQPHHEPARKLVESLPPQ